MQVAQRAREFAFSLETVGHKEFELGGECIADVYRFAYDGRYLVSFLATGDELYSCISLEHAVDVAVVLSGLAYERLASRLNELIRDYS